MSSNCVYNGDLDGLPKLVGLKELGMSKAICNADYNNIDDRAM